MKLHQIRYFLALAVELNFTRAADRCGVAQSSLTRAIKGLEHDLGGALFHRERANTHLTKLGRKVMPFLEQAHGYMEDAKKEAHDFVSNKTTTLNIGLMCTVAHGRFVELISALRTKHPGIALQMNEATAPMLQERLLAGEIDVAIYALPTLTSDDRFNHLPLYSEDFVGAFGATHRLAREKTVRFSDLDGEPYLRRIRCEYEPTVADGFARQGINCPVVYHSDRDDWILAMAAAGMGFAVVPALGASYPGVVARPLTEPELKREIAVVTVRGRPESAALGVLMYEIIRLLRAGR